MISNQRLKTDNLFTRETLETLELVSTRIGFTNKYQPRFATNYPFLLLYPLVVYVASNSLHSDLLLVSALSTLPNVSTNQFLILYFLGTTK